MTHRLKINLKEARLAAGLTQVELAARMGVPQSSIARFESGRDFMWSTLLRYVSALGARNVRLEAKLKGRRGAPIVIAGSTRRR